MMNVIVILSDTVRWDHVSGACRDPLVETPFLEQLSKECVMFDDHYAGSIPTLPNRTDCFTGKTHLTAGGGWGPLDTEIPSLAEMVTDAGYRSQLIVSTPHMVNKNHYYNRGFQFCEWVRDSEEDLSLCPGNAAQPPKELIQPDVKSRHTYYLPGWHLGSLTDWMHGRYQWEEEYVAPRVAKAASKWLEWNYKDGPFFLWVDSFDPHEPWICPQHFRDRFDPDYDGIPMTHPSYGPVDVYTKRELFNLQANYKAQCTFADKWVGHIIQKVKDLGILDNTMLVFTSDHGMLIGEHDRTGKDNHYDGDERHWPVYNEVSHIPLMIRHPQAKGGRHIKGFTQPVDLTKTILEATGAKHPTDLHGHSLLPQLSGEAKRGPRKFSVTGRSIENPAINNGRFLYHPQGEGLKPALYDLKADPMCRKNIYKKNKAQAERMRKQIIAYYEECGSTEEMIQCFHDGKPFAEDLGGLKTAE